MPYFLSSRNSILISTFLVILGVTGLTMIIVWKLDYLSSKESVECLEDYEEITYKTFAKEHDASGITVTINNKQLGTSRSVTTDILNRLHYHPIEVRKCHFYLIQSTNYDYQKRETNRGYKVELQQVDYRGQITPLFTISEDPKGGTRFGRDSGTYRNYFGTDFRISPDEQHVILVRRYSGTPEYALVIKNIGTKEDVLIIPMEDIIRDNPERNGVFDLWGWSEDGRYFWSGTSETAYVKTYIRIDTQTWTYEILDAPEGALGGSPLNMEYGLVGIVPGTLWTGIVEMDEIMRERMREQGHVAQLYVYNLFTKEKVLLAENAEDPMWWPYDMKWISDTELKYTLPDGTEKIYRVEF